MALAVGKNKLGMYKLLLCGAQQLSGRMPDSQSREPGFESPFATVSKIGHFSFSSLTPMFTQLYK